MIAPLRRRHRLMTTLLLVAVPVLYAVALAGRPEEPTARELPAALAEGSPRGEAIEEYGALFAGRAIGVRLRGDGSVWWIELEAHQPIAKPEVLVYWAPEAERARHRLPADAFLLGALAGARARAFALPEAALGRPGRLLLYSLGHHEVLDSAPLPAIGAAPVEQDPETSHLRPSGATDGEVEATEPTAEATS